MRKGIRKPCFRPAAIPPEIRIAVFMQLSVVPITAITTVRAMLIIVPVAKYSIRYARSPWTTREMMIALGMVVLAFFVSAESDVELSNPTRIKMAIVDCISTPFSVWGLTASQAPLKVHAVVPCGLCRR